MKKNRGIIIELTALLDVLMIMLFWVMMNSSQTADKARAEAEQAKNAAKEVSAQAEKEISEQKRKAKEVNAYAQANQQALDDYNKGEGIIINVKYEDEKDKLYINQGEKQVAILDFDGNNLWEQLVKTFEDMGYEKDEPVICTVVYDGDVMLYRNYDKLNNAFERVCEKYNNFYCTLVNTNK